MQFPASLTSSIGAVSGQAARRWASSMHDIAKTGYLSSGPSGLYHRARPSYPEPVLDHILKQSAPKDARPLRIVELGVGTGIATKQLLEATLKPRPDGYQGGLEYLRASDPSDGMRQGFEKNVLDPSAGVVDAEAVRRGLVTFQQKAFEDFDAGKDNDLVLVAQAWHWCNDYQAALERIADTLRPGGVLALIWNMEDRTRAPWLTQIRKFYQKDESNAPQYRTGAWKAMYDKPAYRHFEEIESKTIQRDVPRSLDDIVDRVLSKSWVSQLPEERKQEIASNVRKHLTSHSDEELGKRTMPGDDKMWAYPYQTDWFLFRRK
ncbi:hypothetical protein ACQY0O_002367 [Thecaphora frezii]